MKLSDYIVDFLHSNNISHYGIIYGSAIADLVDSIAKHPQVKYTCFQHEQGMCFAAEGFVKTCNKIMCGIVTSGPGFGNCVTGLQNFFYDSTPFILIAGQANSKFLRPNDSIRQIAFQECDVVKIAESITKYAVEVKNAKDIKYELQKALYFAMSGRPGGVVLSIPLDIQKQEINPDELESFTAPEITFNQDIVIEQIRSYLTDLTKSTRPCLLIGGGVRIANAVQELNEVLHLLRIPCLRTWNAIDIVCDDHQFFCGNVGTYGGKGRNFCLQNSDLLLSIGSRISGRITGGNLESFARGAKKYLVDIDEGLLIRENQQVPFDISVNCDAKMFLKLLKREIYNKWLNLIYPDFGYWLRQSINWKNKYDPVKLEYYNHTTLHPYVFVRELSKLMTKDDILVADCGGNIVTTMHSFESKTGQRLFTNNGNSPMGFSFCGAIGAWFANESMNKKGNVVCIIGDGGAQMNIQEFQTLINYNIKVKTFILNNSCYGITRGFQKSNNLKEVACNKPDYTVPDFKKVASAYGIKTYCTNSNNLIEIHSLIKTVLNYNGPVVADVDCKDFHDYFPKIDNWQAPIEDQAHYLSREEFFQNMLIEPTEFSKTLRAN